jgi:transcriptional regulatory protein LevR
LKITKKKAKQLEKALGHKLKEIFFYGYFCYLTVFLKNKNTKKSLNANLKGGEGRRTKLEGFMAS